MTLHDTLTTGSDNIVPILFVDGKRALADYGAEIRTGGPCPKCHGPVDQTLYFDPLDEHYYFNCPLCNVWLRWCDKDGNISDLAVVKSNKRTPLDIDDDFTIYTGTF